MAERYGAFAPTGGAGAAIEAASLGTANAALAQQQLDRLKTQEISGFSGSSGAGKGSFLGTEEGQG
jgi:H2-forming N5,N10-methylenetetrahydromethanopterin dehydrogenase-like enzyme